LLLPFASLPFSSMSTTSSSPARRVALLTGVTGAIGARIAHHIAAANYTLILPVRNAQKAASIVSTLQQQTGNRDIHIEQVELDSSASVSALCDRLLAGYPTLHLLINNAAIVPISREVTDDGRERQFAVNIAAYYQLMVGLLPALKRAGAEGGQAEPARVVNVASHYAGELRLDDLQWEKRRYESGAAYRQSKQANRMMSYYAAKLWKKDNITGEPTGTEQQGAAEMQG
jgi:NAD(P)-dependent dehydrogenase (short-subunit alcohol dehydrogenase family)